MSWRYRKFSRADQTLAHSSVPLAEHHRIISMRALAAIVLASGLAAGMAWGVAEAAPLEHCVKAEEAYQAGNHALEIEFYTRCIEDEGPRGIKLAIAQNNRGVAHLAVGDPDSAIEDYDRALALDPNYAIAHSNRGMAHLAKGAFVQALRDYDKATELYPAYAQAYANRCWLFGFMGYGETALADCDESLRLRPDHPATLDSRAFAYWILEDPVSARRNLEMARVLDPTRPNWDDRSAAFEKRFSIGHPYSAASLQSADRFEETDEPAVSRRPAPLSEKPRQQKQHRQPESLGHGLEPVFGG
jgi:tetratricopeptide (TPR) repeat protein